VKLTNIEIFNLFSYHGENKISIDSITCVIGTNGFGKTSILNSIKLCLNYLKVDIKSILNNKAQNNKCHVRLDFDDFNICRDWTFGEKVEEKLTITFTDGNTLEDAEAEHFIQNKIPEFLVDFLFYDGEIGNNLLVLSNSKLKSIFDYVFDLDLLVNTQKDAYEVSKRLLEKNRNNGFSEVLELEEKRTSLIEIISNDKETLRNHIINLKIEKMNLQKINTQIRNKNKNLKDLNLQKESIKLKLDEKTIKFKDTILWQMPLLFNSSLYEELKKRSKNIVKIEDENLFNKKFSQFAKEIDSSIEEDKIFEIFKSLMITNSENINLLTSIKDFRQLIDNLKDLKLELTQIDDQIKIEEESALRQEVLQVLITQRDNIEKIVNNLEHSISELENKTENDSLELKEINKKITQSFRENQSQYAVLKGYEELQAISKVSTQLYENKLISNLKVFNSQLKQNTTKFLNQYKHIRSIIVNKNHEIIISDEDSQLNTNLLSAGQKQILNFLIIKTILDFKNFTSFVVVDTPFGRLSNKNKELLLNTCYLNFENLVLLLTDSEYDFIKSQSLKYKKYNILRNDNGSFLEENL
jgi:DNA sulfur modification protein DndD